MGFDALSSNVVVFKGGSKVAVVGMGNGWFPWENLGIGQGFNGESFFFLTRGLSWFFREVLREIGGMSLIHGNKMAKKRGERKKQNICLTR